MAVTKWIVDPAHSEVQFKIKTPGHFDDHRIL
jgi:polyisoprenoid-binding protein YceI